MVICAFSRAGRCLTPLTSISNLNAIVKCGYVDVQSSNSQGEKRRQASFSIATLQRGQLFFLCAAAGAWGQIQCDMSPVRARLWLWREENPLLSRTRPRTSVFKSPTSVCFTLAQRTNSFGRVLQASNTREVKVLFFVFLRSCLC